MSSASGVSVRAEPFGKLRTGEVEARPGVCLVLEGTYPYVSGGVSSWVHTLIGAMPERQFRLLHIGPYVGAYSKRIYELAPNVVGLDELFCQAEPGLPPRVPPGRRERHNMAAGPRVLRAIERLHTGDVADAELIEDLASGDLSVDAFLHGAEAFSLIRDRLYPQLAPGTPFTEFFWHVRAMHVPLLRMLSARAPDAEVYHSASCGYAGVVGAVASARTGRPYVVTEHGLYAREREMELSRTTWIRDFGGEAGEPTELSPLRAMWSHFFRMLSRIAYAQATKLVTLSAVNRDKQLADGADGAKLQIVPNGVRVEDYAPMAQRRSWAGPQQRPMRVGFVGRVVPIKDVVTLIRSVALALESVDLELWIVGPEDEDKVYAKRCRELVATLRMEKVIKFLGRRNVAEVYPELDVMVLTSISEGQPLVILEGNAAGLPVIATDVGACRELLTGRDANDAQLGPSGIVTRIANPADTAEALVRLAKSPRLRAEMGRAGLTRTADHYQLRDVIAAYNRVYDEVVLS